MPHVVLLGLMGAGKTSIGTVVAERLGRPLIDGDERLAELTGGRTAAEISDERGLDALHALEAEIALAALAAADPAVIGPASSVCESAAVRDALQRARRGLAAAPRSSYLVANAVQKSHRPLLDRGDPAELFEEQLAIREPLVLPLADLVVDVADGHRRGGGGRRSWRSWATLRTCADALRPRCGASRSATTSGSSRWPVKISKASMAWPMNRSRPLIRCSPCSAARVISSVSTGE